jgi:DNA-binding Lrp family transcriptional regulator
MSLDRDLLAALSAGSPLSAAALAQRAGVSQPTVSRALSRLSGRVLRIGAAQNTRYAAKHDLLGLSATQPIIWRGPGSASMPSVWGDLTFLHDNWVHVRSGGHEWLCQGRLPWFLAPLRAQGFLGRALARSRPDWPADPARWSLAQVLHVAAAHITDPIGAFSLNEKTPSEPSVAMAVEASLAARCDVLAEQAEVGLPFGSSAGGEQPKFTLHTDDGAAWIVKFTPPRSTRFNAVFATRWDSLLQLEHLALNVLAEHGVPSARTRIVRSERRTYLLAQRFDRPPGSPGAARHVVPLEAVHDEFIKSEWRHWSQSAQLLAQAQVLRAQDATTSAQVQTFGELIGNNDMHPGNLSFFVDDVVNPRLALAPIYDMLPMAWRPNPHHGTLTESPISPPMPRAGFEAAYAAALPWAQTFWARAAGLPIEPALQRAAVVTARRLTSPG